MESSICIQSVHACVSFLRWEEPTQNEFMRAHVNLYMQKFYVEPLLHAGMLHVERVRRETECKPGKTKLFSHPHFVELNNITLQESFFFSCCGVCLTASSIICPCLKRLMKWSFFNTREQSGGKKIPPKTEPCIIAVVITILYLHIVTGCIDLHILMYTSGLHISASMPTVFNVPVILHSPQTQQQL